MDPKPSTTDDASSPGPVDRATTPWRFPSGEWAFLASDWRAFIAAAIDAVLVLGVGVVQYLTVMASPYGTQPQAFAGAALVIVVTAWLYGFITFAGHTLGTMLCGTRIVKVRDGSAPGMLRAGWVMFVRTVIWVVCPIGPPLAAPNTNGKNIPQCRRFHLSIRKAATVSALPHDPAVLEASHGRTNEAHKYVDPLPTAPKKPMDSYYPLVPSQFKDGSWGIQARLWKILLAWAIDLAIAMVVVFALSAALLGEIPRHSWEIAASFVLFAPLFAWFYGMCCARGYSLGTLLVGTRIVRLRNGKAPGPWRGGWVMVYRIVMAASAPFFIFFGMFNGTTEDRDMMRGFHVSIDVRRTKALHKD